jgi:competence protein ComEC
MMPAALIAVLLMPFGLEGVPLLVMGWSVDRMLDMASLVAGWSTHLRAAPLLTPWALIFALAALAWFAFFKDRWRLLGPAVALVLIVVFAVDHPPDVLISDTTQALAVRGPSGLELADGKSQSFALSVWRDTYAEPIDKPAADSCDAIACIGDSAAGFTWALVDDPAGFADECNRADLLITRTTAPSWCKPKALIDAPVLDSTGVQWLRWDAATKTFEVRAAIDHLDRPWRITP